MTPLKKGFQCLAGGENAVKNPIFAAVYPYDAGIMRCKWGVARANL